MFPKKTFLFVLFLGMWGISALAASCLEDVRSLVLKRGLGNTVVEFSNLHSKLKTGSIDDLAAASLVEAAQPRLLQELQGALAPAQVSLEQILAVADELQSSGHPTVPPKAETPGETLLTAPIPHSGTPVEFYHRDMGNHPEALSRKIPVKKKYEVEKIDEYLTDFSGVSHIDWGPHDWITVFGWKLQKNPTGGSSHHIPHFEILKFDRGQKEILKVTEGTVEIGDHTSPVWIGDKDFVVRDEENLLHHWHWDSQWIHKTTNMTGKANLSDFPLAVSSQGVLAVPKNQSIEFFHVVDGNLQPLGQGKFIFPKNGAIQAGVSWDDRGNAITIRANGEVSAIGMDIAGTWNEVGKLRLEMQGSRLSRVAIGANYLTAITSGEEGKHLFLLDVSDPEKMKLVNSGSVDPWLRKPFWLNQNTLIFSSMKSDVVVDVPQTGSWQPHVFPQANKKLRDHEVMPGPDGFILMKRPVSEESRETNVALERWDAQEKRLKEIRTFSEGEGMDPRWGSDGRFLLKKHREGKVGLVIYQIQ